jgi:hypothetical protein
MATARHNYADLPLVCRSALSMIMSKRNPPRHIMRQKSDFALLKIAPHEAAGASLSTAERDRFLLQHRIDLGFAGGGFVASAEPSNAALLRRGADWIFRLAPSSSNQLSSWRNEHRHSPSDSSRNLAGAKRT